MRGRTLLILTLLVAALGAFVWFVERDLPDTKEREERADRLLDVEADDVQRIELSFDGKQVVLEREPAGEKEKEKEEDEGLASASPEWRLVEPFAARADAGEVGSLVRRLASLDAARTLDAVEDPAAYGLEPPRLEIVLGTADGERRLRVGETLPASSQRLVSLGETGPYRLIEGGIFETATRDPGDWRDHDLFPWSRADVERVRLPALESSEPLLLARRGEQFWVEAPFVDAADPDRVDRLLLGLTGLEADAFLDAAPEGAATGPALEVSVKGRDEPVSILLAEAGHGQTPPSDSDAEPGTEGASRTETVRVGDVWAKAKTDLREVLDATADGWRSPRLTGWPVYEIDTIRVRQGDDETTLSRDGVDWRRGEDKILYSTVSDLLTALVGFRAEAVEPSTGPPAGAPPTLEITLTHKEGAQETLEVRRAEDGVVTVRPAGRDVTLRAPATAWEPIATALDTVRKAEPLPAEKTEDESAESAD